MEPKQPYWYRDEDHLNAESERSSRQTAAPGLPRWSKILLIWILGIPAVGALLMAAVVGSVFGDSSAGSYGVFAIVVLGGMVILSARRPGGK